MHDPTTSQTGSDVYSCASCKEGSPFRRAILHAPIAIIMQADDGEVIQLSTVWCELTGYAASDMCTGAAWLGLLDDPGSTLMNTRFADVLRGEPRAPDIECCLRTSDGEKRHLSFSASCPGLLADGRHFVVAVAVDITDRKVAELAIIAAKAAAEAASAAKDLYLANISHELRTPISVIVMWSRMLTRAGIAEIDRAEALTAIARSAESQRRLLDDLLDVTRIASGKLRVTPGTLELRAAVKAAADAVRQSCSEKHISLEIDLPDDLPPIAADPGRIEQVLIILLGNAVKFTPEHGSVRLEARADNDNLIVSITDSGVGIGADLLPRIFLPFVQGDSDTSRLGLGLGLPIAKSLIEMHAGSIDATSDGDGRGARFTFSLPRTSPPHPQPRHASTARHLPLAGRRILLVDDNADVRRAAGFALSQAGAQVCSLASGAVALEHLEVKAPDLLVSDLRMPHPGGLELIRQIRDREQARGAARLPAIALTVMASAIDREAARNAGFDDFIPKPVDPETLIARILQILEE